MWTDLFSSRVTHHRNISRRISWVSVGGGVLSLLFSVCNWPLFSREKGFYSRYSLCGKLSLYSSLYNEVLPPLGLLEMGTVTLRARRH